MNPVVIPSATNKSHGFTLVELMMVVVIIGILAGIAAPQYGGLIKKQSLLSESRRITSLLKLARSESRARGAHVTIYREAADWSSTLQVFENVDLDDGLDIAAADEEIKISEGGRSLIADASLDDPYIIFNPRGWVQSAFSLAICASATEPTDGRLIVVNRVGHITEKALEEDESCTQ